jgi:hypothetical protein
MKNPELGTWVSRRKNFNLQSESNSSFSEFKHLAVHHDGEVFFGGEILELHDLMALLCQLGPPARLTAVLFDGDNGSVFHHESDTSQPAAPDSAYEDVLIVNDHLRTIHQLRGH